MLLGTNRKSINLYSQWPSAVELHRYLRVEGCTLHSRQNQVNNSMFSSVFEIALAWNVPMGAFNIRYVGLEQEVFKCTLHVCNLLSIFAPLVLHIKSQNYKNGGSPVQAGKICQIHSMILAWWWNESGQLLDVLSSLSSRPSLLARCSQPCQCAQVGWYRHPESLCGN